LGVHTHNRMDMAVILLLDINLHTSLAVSRNLRACQQHLLVRQCSMT